MFLKSLKVTGVSLTFLIPWNAVASLEKFDVAWHQNDRRFFFKKSELCGVDLCD